MLIDLYLLTMAQAYWQCGRTGIATFSLYFRDLPPERGYQLFMGLEDVLDELEHFTVGRTALGLLEERGDFAPDFLSYLSNLRFTGSLRAMPEGTPCFPREPVLEVTAPVIEGQLVETSILNHVNLQTTLATKARRVVTGAAGASVVDFGARRAHGEDAATKMARVGYAAGFAGTSNVEAAQRYGLPAVGTMAHSFVTAYHSEVDAFRAYLESFPDSPTLLVDTYDVRQGMESAVVAAREASAKGASVGAIRLDSGDLSGLSLYARNFLDEAGLVDVEIVASGGLDEHSISELASGGAPIDCYGVGTAVCTSADAPSTECVFKMVEYEGRPVAKFSQGKASLPGRKQVYRLTEQGTFQGDRLQSAQRSPPTGSDWFPLLSTVMENGRRTRPAPSLEEIRSRISTEMGKLPGGVQRLSEPDRYPVEISDDLVELASTLTSPAQ